MKITICGSMAFHKDMEELMEKLLKKGHEVKTPEVRLEVPETIGGKLKPYFGKYIEENGGIDAFPPDHSIWEMKRDAIENHFDKIEWSDAVVIVNHEKRGVEGYIGGNTLIEIALAFYLKKKIYILNPISSDLSYKQEIYGMNPILLEGSLEPF